MKVQFFGAVRTVTGSMHYLEVNGTRILLDCGLFQGRRQEAFERNRNLPIAPADIDLLILSHAHIDHCGNIPTLARHGFRGRIYATHATADLAGVMLRDSAHIQTKDVEYVNKQRKRDGKRLFEPLYELEDVESVLPHFSCMDYATPFEVCPGVRCTFYDAGHMLGSASPFLEIDEGSRNFTFGFTGDIGRKRLPILRDPQVLPPVDWLISESTYGNRLHPPAEDLPEQLARLVEKTFDRGGSVVIPAFSVGRTQNLVYTFHELFKAGRLPRIPVFVDSPLSSNATEVFRRHPECFDGETLDLLASGEDPFGLGDVTYIRHVQDSKKLNERQSPCVIISASGMCEAGRILHHLRHRVEDSRNLILIVGFQAAHTLGRRFVLRVPQVKIFGDEYALRAEVALLNGYSGHADRNELIDYIGACARDSKGIFLVHGDEEQSLALQAHLESRRFKQVHVPHYQQAFEVS
jgi:metallo-beta-lactamase family protein